MPFPTMFVFKETYKLDKTYMYFVLCTCTFECIVQGGVTGYIFMKFLFMPGDNFFLNDFVRFLQYHDSMKSTNTIPPPQLFFPISNTMLVMRASLFEESLWNPIKLKHACDRCSLTNVLWCVCVIERFLVPFLL